MEGTGNEEGREPQNEQIPRNCLDILPFEMWQEILLKVKGKGANKTLLNCRGISSGMERVAQNVLFGSVAQQFRKGDEFQDDPSVVKEWAENPWGRNKFAFFFHKKQMGTRFGDDEDVRLFLAQMQGQEGAPFPNGYVIYSPSFKRILNRRNPERKAQAFHMAFETLTVAFPALITSLLYDVSYISSIGLIAQLSAIFKLENLRNLILCNNYGTIIDCTGIQSLIENGCLRFPQAPPLTQLHLYGFEAEDLAIFRIFSNLPPFKNSISHFGFLFYWGDEWLQEQPPNEPLRDLELPSRLHYLKMIQPTDQILEHFLVTTDDRNAPALTELDIRFDCYGEMGDFDRAEAEEETRVIRLLRALDAQQSKTLETMNWNTVFNNLYDGRGRNARLKLNMEVKYPRLRHFSINYFIVKHWRNLINQLAEKFPNLEIFTVTAGPYCKQDLSGMQVGRRAIYDVVSTLWEEFPATSNLREIRVPCYNWNLTRDGPLPLGVLPDIE